jgi:hypothetical protein
MCVQVSDCGAHNGPFRKNYFNHREDCGYGTHALPKHVAGYFVHQYVCIYTSAYKVGCMKRLKTRYLMCHHKPARKQQMQSVGRKHRSVKLQTCIRKVPYSNLG